MSSEVLKILGQNKGLICNYLNVMAPGLQTFMKISDIAGFLGSHLRSEINESGTMCIFLCSFCIVQTMQRQKLHFFKTERTANCCIAEGGVISIR